MQHSPFRSLVFNLVSVFSGGGNGLEVGGEGILILILRDTDAPSHILALLSRYATQGLSQKQSLGFRNFEIIWFTFFLVSNPPPLFPFAGGEGVVVVVWGCCVGGWDVGWGGCGGGRGRGGGLEGDGDGVGKKVRARNVESQDWVEEEGIVF